jgi:hypothetical protein
MNAKIIGLTPLIVLAVMLGGVAVLGAGCRAKTLDGHDEKTMPNTFCVENADGKFSVNYFDKSKRGFVGWKGVRLTREQLPVVWPGPFHVVTVVYIYERPTWLRRLCRTLPADHFWTPPSHRIIGEGDPPIASCLRPDTGDLELFCQIGPELYVIKKIRSPKLKKDAKINIRRGEGIRRITIDIPAHRVKEVEKILSELLESNPELSA